MKSLFKMSSKAFYLSFVLLLALSEFGQAANILFFIGGIASHSHRVSVQPLANKLAEKGHKVTFFAPLNNPTSHPSIQDFCTKELKGFNDALLVQFGVVGLNLRLQNKFANEILSGTALFDGSYVSCSSFLQSPELKPWIAKNKFDLVVIDGVVNECAFGLAHVFKAKTALFGPISTIMPWDADVFGFPTESSWVPTMDNNYDGEMGFYERFVNTWTNLYWAWKWESFHMPRLDALVRDSLNVPDMPPLIDMVKSAGVYLLNQHYSDQFARSYPPFVVQVGGMHLQEGRKPLPPELEKFVQGAGDEGFIYISFGSVVKISTVPPEFVETFFNAIKNTKLRYLWKWEGDVPKNAPANVLFQAWFPQQDLLAHPKIKGYIMQGGQISVQQAICNAVPLIIFPVNGDQDISGKRVRQIRNGIEMELANVTSASLQQNIEKLVYEPGYAQKAKQQAKVCKDRPMSAVDTAVWWLEHVLRQENTDHLKPLSMKQNWFIYRSLDVFGVIFLALFNAATAGLVALYIVYRVYKFFKGQPQPKVKTS